MTSDPENKGDSPSLFNRIKQEVDELALQLNLGKAEAVDFVEEQKGKLSDFVEKMKDSVGAGGGDSDSPAEDEGVNRLKQKLDELRLQLALGKMESREMLEEQRDRIRQAIDDARDEWEPVQDDLKESFSETSESLKTKLDALALDLGIRKAVAEEKLAEKKEQLKSELSELKEKLQPTMDSAGETLTEIGNDARAGFEKVRNTLKGLFD